MTRLPRIAACMLVAVFAALLVNGIVQVARKPSELLFPVSGRFFHTPAETWARYASSFRQFSTDTMTPDLLAALAQQEGAGNPIARTYWRWSWTAAPFQMYRPASSSVGLYQMTDGTFAQAKHYCVRRHQALRDSTALGQRACGSGSLYLRLLPSHAVELTAGYLDAQVTEALARNRIEQASLRQRQHLAGVIHLCGAGAADAYAKRHFHFFPGERCGDHDPRAYLSRVDDLQAVFGRLASRT